MAEAQKELLHALEQRCDPAVVAEGAARAEAGRVWGVRGRVDGTRVQVTGTALDPDGTALDVRVSLGPRGLWVACDCGGTPGCCHAVAVVRAWIGTGLRATAPGRAWRPVLHGLARRPAPQRPMPREAVVAHWLEWVPRSSGAYGLRVSWRVHRLRGRGIGPGRPVSPASLVRQDGRAVPGADPAVLRAVRVACTDAALEDRAGVVLTGEQVDPVLRALTRASHVLRTDSRTPVRFDLRPERVRLEVRGTETGVRVRARGLGGPDAVRVVGSNPPWLDDGTRLRPVLGVADGDALVVLGGPGVAVPREDLAALLGTVVPDLEAAGVEVDLAGVDRGAFVIDPEPVPRLYLSEEGGDLVALLRFRYGDYEVAAENPDPVFPVGDRQLRRNLDEEFQADRLLQESGLEVDEPGRYRASGDRALGFLADGLPALGDGWEVFGQESLVRHRLAPRAASASLRVGGGIDWLDLALEVRVGDEDIPADEVLDALRRGSRFVRLADGSHARLADAWLERVAADLDRLGVGTGARSRVPGYLAPLVQEVVDAAPGAAFENRDAWEHLLAALRGDGVPALAPPAGLTATLRPYQLEGYRWLRFLGSFGFGGVLADDMGLGKTVQALAVLQGEKEDGSAGPNLVVAPTSVVANWEAEARRFTPQLRVVRYHGADRRDLGETLAGADLVVTSYAILRRDVDLLSNIPWRYAILDEAQAIKNAATQTARAATRLQARRRLALTGTPLENHLGELWSQFQFLMPGLLGTEAGFVREFARPIADGDEAARERLRRRIRPFVLRRLKREAAPDLPPKVESVLLCEMEPDQERVYRSLLAASRDRVLREVAQRGLAKARFTVLEALLRLRQACCHPPLLPGGLGDGVGSAKFDLFGPFVTEVLDEGHRVLVFSQFVRVLGDLRRWFDDQGIRYEYLDGSTRDREARIRRFQEDDGVRAFLVSLKAGGAGLNLAGADYVILFDPWWNPAVEAQATDRAHRIGQTRTVFSYKMITRGTVEEKILQLQDRKRHLTETLLDADADWSSALTEEDVAALFDEA